MTEEDRVVQLSYMIHATGSPTKVVRGGWVGWAQK